ncbi:MAG: 50S ribosomal protein L15 [Gemmatimonadota bacterium]|nr:MAG: 50S ribosomal protein L15 [Gemmatimonadota bacterium]
MKLNELKKPQGARKKRKRVGRGEGSGHGGTSCRGHKGQKSRSGVKIPAWFEGGQMPIQRRLPKKGFTNIFKKEYQIVNVQDLARCGDEKIITPHVLRQKGIIKKERIPVKVLGVGEVAEGMTVRAHAFSATAKAKIEKAKGSVEVI